MRITNETGLCQVRAAQTDLIVSGPRQTARQPAVAALEQRLVVAVYSVRPVVAPEVMPEVLHGVELRPYGGSGSRVMFAGTTRSRLVW